MIIDLKKFIADGYPCWQELDDFLTRIEGDPLAALNLDDVKRFHYLYQRASVDLSRLDAFSADPTTRDYLEALVSRAYGECHATGLGHGVRFRPYFWLVRTLPRTFRRHIGAFWLSVAVTLLGGAFGGLALGLDPDAKEVIVPLAHLRGSPGERVAEEEQYRGDQMEGSKASFSATLMTHNTRVAIFTMGLGITLGAGTCLMLFYNGVVLGAVFIDYVIAGETEFVLGWLLPHGSAEIPAILMAGQAGLVLAGAVLNRRGRTSAKERLRDRGPDIVTLMGGVFLMLIWAGLVEAFLSQYHQPVLPYPMKILLGVVELAFLLLFFGRAGKESESATG